MDVQVADSRAREGGRDLAPLMRPRSVAVLGASQRAARGTRVVANLQRFAFPGPVYPINPKYDEVRGLRCYPDLRATPEPADCVVVAIPAEHVPAALAEAADAGVRAAVVLSSGFSEVGAAGEARYAALERLAHERAFPICGPNCYGVFNIHARAPAFSGEIPDPLRPGGVALISQSGGLSTQIAIPLMHGRAIGFSYLISCGNQAGTTVEDYLEYLVEDDATRVIAAFVEGFKQPAKLRQVAARAAALGKPLIMMKVGRSENARQATLAHTGSLAGTPEIVDALLRQCGIVQVHGLNELVETIALFASARDYAGGWRLAALSGSGGECGLVADAAAVVGLAMPSLSPASVARLQDALPAFARPRNPLDGTGAVYEDPRLYPQIVDTLLGDDAVDVVAIHLNAEPPKPSGRTPSRDFSRVIRDAVQAAAPTRPRLVVAFGSMTGSVQDGEVVQTLAEAGVPYLDGTELAMRALAHLRAYRAFVARSAPPQPPSPEGRGEQVGGTPPTPPGRVWRGILRAPLPLHPRGEANGEAPGRGAPLHPRGGDGEQPAGERAPRLSRRAPPLDPEGAISGVLGTAEAMRWLEAGGIPLVPTRFAADAAGAVAAADALGYPVVLKIESPDVAHKSDVGGVRVGCADAAAVRAAYAEMMAEVARRLPGARLAGVAVQPLVADGVEVILGVKVDPLFGPAVVLGLGGVLVEVLHDVALRLPPFGMDDARAMIAELRGTAVLSGVRGRPPADVAALADTLVRLGALALAHADRLAALDLNPVLVRPAGHGVVAVDWLVEMR